MVPVPEYNDVFTLKGQGRVNPYECLKKRGHHFLNGFFIAQNPITFYLFFELALIPIYFLVLNWGGAERKKAVFKFFIYILIS